MDEKELSEAHVREMTRPGQATLHSCDRSFEEHVKISTTNLSSTRKAYGGVRDRKSDVDWFKCVLESERRAVIRREKDLGFL